MQSPAAFLPIAEPPIHTVGKGHRQPPVRCLGRIEEVHAFVRSEPRAAVGRLPVPAGQTHSSTGPRDPPPLPLSRSQSPVRDRRAQRCKEPHAPYLFPGRRLSPQPTLPARLLSARRTPDPARPSTPSPRSLLAAVPQPRRPLGPQPAAYLRGRPGAPLAGPACSRLAPAAQLEGLQGAVLRACAMEGMHGGCSAHALTRHAPVSANWSPRVVRCRQQQLVLRVNSWPEPPAPPVRPPVWPAASRAVPPEVAAPAAGSLAEAALLLDPQSPARRISCAAQVAAWAAGRQLPAGFLVRVKGGVRRAGHASHARLFPARTTRQHAKWSICRPGRSRLTRLMGLACARQPSIATTRIETLPNR